LAAEILASPVPVAAPAKQRERQPDPSDFPLPEPSQPSDAEHLLPLGLSEAEKIAVNKAISELERLREQLQKGLSINFTGEESEAWLATNYGKELKDLHKGELKAAIAKLNAEMDAREGIEPKNLF
jgi:hypothetical protein